LPLVASSEMFVEEEAICVMWVSGSDTMQRWENKERIM
jgi:hypothetical protein